MDTKGKNELLSRNKGVFMAAEVEKKETPSKGCLRKYLVMRFLGYARNDITRLLVKRSSNVNRTSNA